MTCQQFHQQLERAIESRTPPSPEVRQHGETCAESRCLQAWNEHCLLEQAVAEWRNFEESIDLVDQVLAAHGDDRSRLDRKEATSSPRSPVRVGWIAATVSLALLMMLMVLRSNAPDPQRGQLAQTEANGKTPNGEIPRQNQQQAVVSGRSAEQLAELGSAYGEFVEHAARRVTETDAFAFLDEEPATSLEAVAPDWLRRWQERLDRTFEPFMVPSSDEQSQRPDRPSPNADSLT